MSAAEDFAEFVEAAPAGEFNLQEILDSLDLMQVSLQEAVSAARITEPELITDAFQLLPGDMRSLSLATRTELLRQQAKRAVQHALDREEREANYVEPPPVRPLVEMLAEPDDEAQYRVAELMPRGGRVVVTAAHKSGKTTLAGNLTRSLVDGDDFLDTYPVEQAERVTVIDNELDERMLRRWYRDQGIRTPERVQVLSLRGRVSSFDIMDAATRAEWAEALRGTDVLIFDCLRPALDALGLSEDKEAGLFLDALGELAAAAGVGELLILHHTGHAGERSRGDSRILDWPDAIWKLARESRDKPVFFSAYGRDVDVPPRELGMDPETRHLTVVGDGQRVGEAGERAVLTERIAEWLAVHPGSTTNQIKTRVTGNERELAAALALMVDDGLVERVAGPNRAQLHTLVKHPVALEFEDSSTAVGSGEAQ